MANETTNDPRIHSNDPIARERATPGVAGTDPARPADYDARMGTAPHEKKRGGNYLMYAIIAILALLALLWLLGGAFDMADDTGPVVTPETDSTTTVAPVTDTDTVVVPAD